jgi:hypothetical protein
MVFVTAEGAGDEGPDAEDPRGSAQLLQNFDVSGFAARHLGHSMARAPFLIALP